jgi:hypothetical protein
MRFEQPLARAIKTVTIYDGEHGGVRVVGYELWVVGCGL